MFELLFKYPASIFHKGHFVLLTPWPLWLLGLAILAAAGLLFWHVRRNHGMLSGLRPVAIWLLETGMVALILFLLWHPALSVATLRPQQNVVAVLVDDSRSMSIADASGTREAAAKAVLDSGLLKSLGDKFQVRLVQVRQGAGAHPEDRNWRPTAPASRIGDTLERVLAESSSLPLGAIVLLSDGADNAGGIDLQTIAGIRRQRIPVHTIGFGREHPEKDVEIADAVVPARALPQSQADRGGDACRATASRAAKRASACAMTARCSPPRRSPSRADGQIQSETAGVQLRATPGRRRSRSGSSRSPARRTPGTTRVTRLVNVESRKPRILYFEGEPRWEYKFIRRALDDFPNIELASMLRTTQNKIYRQGFHRRAGTGRRLSLQGRGSVPVPGPDHRQRGGQLLHRHPAAVDPRFRGPARRRPALPRRPRLALRRRLPELAAGGPGPHRLPAGKGTFHRDFTGEELTPAGAQSVICRLDDDPVAQRRALEEDAADGQLPGSGRAQARRHRAARIHARRQAPLPAAGHRELRPRAAPCCSPPEEAGAGRCGSTTPTRRMPPSGSRCSATW